MLPANLIVECVKTIAEEKIDGDRNSSIRIAVVWCNGKLEFAETLDNTENEGVALKTGVIDGELEVVIAADEKWKYEGDSWDDRLTAVIAAEKKWKYEEESEVRGK